MEIRLHIFLVMSLNFPVMKTHIEGYEAEDLHGYFIHEWEMIRILFVCGSMILRVK